MASKVLRIAKQLTLPIEAVTEVLGWIGRRGQGKTYGAQKLAEEFYAANAQFVVLDPVGNWWGLRLGADGKAAGIPLPVLGGLRGDLPLESTAGAVIADLVVDRGVSIVVDVSQFESDAAKARFAHDFGARFYFRKKSKPSAVHLFLEEAQEFVPQNPNQDETRMLHVFSRITKLGRNFGIGVSLITQRPQEVHKKVLNLTELLFVFQLTGKHERKAIEDWIADKDIDEDIKGDLPKLRVAHPHAWSPAWLQISEVVAIEKKWTFDASSTPKVGASSQGNKPLAPIDLAELQKQMAATIEKARADDPAALRKMIADLKRDLTAKERELTTRKGPVVTKPVRDEEAIRRAVQQAEAAAGKRLDGVLRRLLPLGAKLRDVAASFEAVMTSTKETATTKVEHMPLPPEPAPRVVGRRPIARDLMPSLGGKMTDNGELTPSDRKILDALALMETLGTPSTRAALGFFAGYAQAGRFNNLVGSLNTRGFVQYPGDGMVVLTDAGRAHTDPDASPIRSVSDLHELWSNKLEPSQWRVLSALLENYPDAMDRETLAKATNYEVAGRFNNLVGSLKTLGAVDYPTKGTVRASDVLFPEGLT